MPGRFTVRLITQLLLALQQHHCSGVRIELLKVLADALHGDQ